MPGCFSWVCLDTVFSTLTRLHCDLHLCSIELAVPPEWLGFSLNQRRELTSLEGWMKIFYNAYFAFISDSDCCAVEDQGYPWTGSYYNMFFNALKHHRFFKCYMRCLKWSFLKTLTKCEFYLMGSAGCRERSNVQPVSSSQCTEM